MSPSEATPPAAITAFLRGCERRARAFVRWHGGHPRQASEVWEQASQHFQQQAQDTAIGHWPRLFWHGLLEAPALRAMPAAEDVAIPGFGRMARGPRAVVLLRLVAGLDDEEAGAALGITAATYRLALHKAMPRLHDGQLDEETWRVLQQRINAELRTDTPQARSRPLPAHNPAAISTGHREADPADAPPRPARWRGPAMLATVVLTLAALALTFRLPELLPDPEDEALPGAVIERTILSEALPATTTPAGYDADFAVYSDADFELLLANPATDALQSQAFDAWYAAQLADIREAEARAAAEALPLVEGHGEVEEGRDDGL